MRLDVLLFETGKAPSRSRAKLLIESGTVTVNGITVRKPSHECSAGDEIGLTGDPVKFVSRGGLKLEAALDAFRIEVSGLTAADIGASTGGFTDCLLSRGAGRVYAIDSGHGQLHERLRSDPRVVSLEGVNAKSLSAEITGGRCDIVVLDVSFISQTKIFASVNRLISPGGVMVSLVKPQFEAGRQNIGKGGIVRDKHAREEALANVINEAAHVNLICAGAIESPIRGGDGNIEYLAHFVSCVL